MRFVSRVRRWSDGSCKAETLLLLGQFSLSLLSPRRSRPFVALISSSTGRCSHSLVAHTPLPAAALPIAQSGLFVTHCARSSTVVLTSLDCHHRYTVPIASLSSPTCVSSPDRSHFYTVLTAPLFSPNCPRHWTELTSVECPYCCPIRNHVAPYLDTRPLSIFPLCTHKTRCPPIRHPYRST